MNRSWSLVHLAWRSTLLQGLLDPKYLARWTMTNTFYSPSYSNVYKTRSSTERSPYAPLLYLLPFIVTLSLRLFWISTPSFTQSRILNSSQFVPFLSSWGLQFAHQVGRMILAHITKTSIPFIDWSWPVLLVCGIDANLPHLFGMLVFLSPIEFQNSELIKIVANLGFNEHPKLPPYLFISY